LEVSFEKNLGAGALGSSFFSKSATLRDTAVMALASDRRIDDGADDLALGGLFHRATALSL
jgi:hypothetical protein